MGWDKGRYYTRSKRVNGKVVREYIGNGPRGEAAAREDAAKREQRRAQREALFRARAEVASFDAVVHELNALTDQLVQETLTAAGYRQHKRGEWRKQRERHQPDTGERVRNSPKPHLKERPGESEPVASTTIPVADSRGDRGGNTFYDCMESV